MRRLSLLALLLAAPADAAPPTLTALAPRSAQRGTKLNVILAGTNLTPATRLSLPFAAEQKLLPDAKPNPALVRLELTVDARVAPGVYPVRVVNEGGLSSLALFRVDTVVIGAEVEDNSSFDKAQKLPTWPIAVEGQCAGGDVDFFRISAKKGQRVSIETESARLGSGVLPQLRVTDAKKRFVAADDSQSLNGDARVSFVATKDEDYVIELSDSRYRGGTPPFYRLRITEQDTAEEVFPLGGRRGEQATFSVRGGTLAKPLTFSEKLADGPFSGLSLLSRDGGMPWRLAVGDLPEIIRKDEGTMAMLVKPPLLINGRLTKEGRADKVRFAVAPGSRWRFVVEAESLGSRLDGVLQVSDEKNRPLLTADDIDLPAPLSIRTADPSGEVTVPADVKELTVSLRDQRERGGVGYGYRLSIEPAADDFSLSLPVSELNIPRGGAMALPVSVARRGFTGPIALTVTGLPAGLRVRGGRVAVDAVAGVLTIEATDAAGDAAQVSVEGKATIGKEVKRAATQRLLLARESGAAGVYSLPKLAVARTSAAPFTVTVPEKLTLVKGYLSEIPVKLARGKGQEKLAVTLTVLPPGPIAGPTGFTLRAAAPLTTDEAKLGVTPGVSAPEGEADFAVQAQARVGSDDVRLSSSAIAAVIAPPFVASVDGPLELKPGQTVKLTGKVARQAVCKEPVRLALAGLPAGVTLTAPRPVAPTETTFALELKVPAKLEKFTGKATLTASATVSGQNYAQRPIEVAVK